MITFDSVDFPEPFGPISAWISPWRTVRSIPRRISLPSTVACSPRTSSVVGSVAGVSFVISSSHLDPHIVFGHGHRVAGDRFDRRQPEGLAGVHIEQRTVFWALDRALLRVDLALVEEEVLVRAHGVERAEPV